MKKYFGVLLGALILFGTVSTQAAAPQAQYRADHATAIADGGSTGGDATIFLDATSPIGTSGFSTEAICPTSGRPHIPELTEFIDDYSVNGFEVKPSAVPLNNTGFVGSTTNTAIAGGLLNSLAENAGALLPGSYHWRLSYTHSAGTITSFCDGTSQNSVRDTTSVTPEMSFVAIAPAIGTITVTSRNSIIGTLPVAASWDFSAADDPCVPTSASCLNIAEATYRGVADGIYTILPASGSAGQQYSFNSIRTIDIAEKKSESGAGIVFFLGRELLISIAHAFSFPLSNPSSQSITSGGSASFIILWDPIAAMSITPTAASLTSLAPSQTIGVSNSGPAGSNLTWSSSITYSAGSGWLSVAPASNASGVTGGSSQIATLIANRGSLAPGSYAATVHFTGVSTVDGSAVAPVSIPVSFAVALPSSVCGNGTVEAPEACDLGAGNGICPAACSASCTTQVCPPQPSCIFTANPTRIVVPEQSELTYNCIHVTQCNLLGGQFGSSPGQGLPIIANTASGTVPVSPNRDTLYTLSCYGEVPPPGSNLNYQQNVNVNVRVDGSHIIEINPPPGP